MTHGRGVEHGRARLWPIEIGRRNAEAAEVVSGLAAGDEVIAYPSDAVADGVKVARRRTT